MNSTIRLSVTAAQNPYSPHYSGPVAPRAVVAATTIQRENEQRRRPRFRNNLRLPRTAPLLAVAPVHVPGPADAPDIAHKARGLNGVKPHLVAVAQAIRQIAPELSGAQIFRLLGVPKSGRAYLRYYHCTEGLAWFDRSHDERAAAGWVALEVLRVAGL